MAKLWCDSPIIKRAHETGHVQARDQIMWCISVDVKLHGGVPTDALR